MDSKGRLKSMGELFHSSFGRYTWAWLFVWAVAIVLLLLPGPFELWARLGWL